MDPDLMNYWYGKLEEKGGDKFKAEVGKVLQQKSRQIDVAVRAFCLLWDRHTPPLKFWAYPPMAFMFERVLKAKGFAVRYDEAALGVLVHRLGLKKSEHTVMRWSGSAPVKDLKPHEILDYLELDVGAARVIGLPTVPES